MQRHLVLDKYGYFTLSDVHIIAFIGEDLILRLDDNLNSLIVSPSTSFEPCFQSIATQPKAN